MNRQYRHGTPFITHVSALVAMAMTMKAGIWKLLMAAHADVVLHGDEHDSERFAPRGAAGRRATLPLV